MTDQQLALQAVSEAQRILEEYLEPRPHDHERILDRLVEVLERPDLVVAVDRLQGGNGWGSQEKTARALAGESLTCLFPRAAVASIRRNPNHRTICLTLPGAVG